MYIPKDGVQWYTQTTIAFDEYFPEGRVCCRVCRFCRYDKNFGAFSCMITNECLERENLDGRGKDCRVQLPDTPF